MTETNNDTIVEKINLDKAYINYHKIIDKNLPYKFSYLDEWMLKSSKFLLKETVTVNKKYRVYKRGTIVKIDFGVGLGSEMSQVHFAIILNKQDNPNNNVLTVLPLTSKKQRFNLDLGPLILEKFISKIKKELLDLGKREEFDNYDEATKIEKMAKIRKLNSLLDYYEKNQKNTYACLSLITTVSKTRILKPINEFDILGRARCSNETMNLIDKSIINNFTNFNLTSENK